MSHKATCQTCKQFSTFASRRSLATKDLPLVLSVNASAYNEENLSFWLDDKSTFLNPTIEIQGQVEGVDDPDIAIYKLRVRILLVVLNISINRYTGADSADHNKGETLSLGGYYSR